MVVSAVAPRSGKAGTQVTIDGSGFAQGAAVRFKDTTAAGPITVKSPTRIIATVVPSRLPDPETVDVTVTVGVTTSPAGPAGEFMSRSAGEALDRWPREHPRRHGSR
ncbi:IPT/TIG domain-containing protein [Streptomyces inhibens]|uniref:IPT/TIG domain-containing protein n=1 Tax=Streptomyces inhibens TaxID=2293571 RepID=UPI001FD4B17A|nr:IPT/TIG domain-containing protein [Streptomyces inhibens]